MYSMTGFGSAVVLSNNINVSVELKTVNNRYFKLMLRITENFGMLESRVESMLRREIERGSVNAIVRIRIEKQSPKAIISAPVLLSYAEQISELRNKLEQIRSFEPPNLYQLLTLPGVIVASQEFSDEEIDNVWSVTEQAINEAITQLKIMRKTEGESMKQDLKTNIDQIAVELTKIEKLAPQVAAVYRSKLAERINRAMSEKQFDVTINDADLLREAAIYADKYDISEEIVRMRSHLDQFNIVVDKEIASGRKLDFLSQELFRETNTIGAKANDTGIIIHVVAIKTIIERIREMVQNVE
ncbi:MAG: YicC family protein [Planctomycetaceae bacterium]|nr:YicC family protein [Planctomycetaceae bacterium]